MGNAVVTTTGSDAQADNIDVAVNMGWSGTNMLTLDAYQSITVSAKITIKGKSALSLVTNDGGSAGTLSFGHRGSITFHKLRSQLQINGASYTLVGSVSGLASLVKANPGGNFALAANYDASQDGTYSDSPIVTPFAGAFEGLGNVISKLTIDVTLKAQNAVGLFSTIDQAGRVSDLQITKTSISVGSGQSRHVDIGALAGSNSGSIVRCEATGTVNGSHYSFSGGLLGANSGTILNSFASVTVKARTYRSGAGGIVGENYGQITASYSVGEVSAKSREGSGGGGLAALNVGTIANSYATGKVHGIDGIGGLVGGNLGQISASYSTGHVSGSLYVGGLIGEDGSPSGSLTDTYWDTDTSGISDPSQGAGNISNDPGITGLTTAQLQSGLPPGFDSSVWGENANINNGLPYLLAIPPK
jgi:hypothetical protein